MPWEVGRGTTGGDLVMAVGHRAAEEWEYEKQQSVKLGLAAIAPHSKTACYIVFVKLVNVC